MKILRTGKVSAVVIEIQSGKTNGCRIAFRRDELYPEELNYYPFATGKISDKVLEMMELPFFEESISVDEPDAIEWWEDKIYLTFALPYVEDYDD